MLLNRVIAGICIALISTTAAAQISDVNQCRRVVDGHTEIIEFAAEMAYGKKVRLKGLLDMPKGRGPFRPAVLLPGARGPQVPGCYGLAVEQLLGWGFATLMVIPVPAREADGTEIYQFSFADLGNYAHGAAKTLAAVPNVIPVPMLLWGHSRGGGAVIDAVSYGKGTKDRFRAAVALAPHPACPAKPRPPAIPLLVMLGTDDPETPAKRCIEYAAKLDDAEGFAFHLLQGGGHNYWPSRQPGYSEAAAQAATRHLKAFLKKNSLLPR